MCVILTSNHAMLPILLIVNLYRFDNFFKEYCLKESKDSTWPNFKKRIRFISGSDKAV